MKLLNTVLLVMAAYLAATAFLHASSLTEMLTEKPRGKQHADTEPQREVEQQPQYYFEASQPYVITEADLMAEFVRALEKKYNPEGELQVFPVRVWRGMRVPSHSWKVEVYRFPSGGIERRFSLGFRIHSEGQIYASMTMPVRAELWQPGLVTAKAFNAGDTLKSGDFTAHLIDVLNYRDGIVPYDKDVAHLEAKRSLNSGEPLFWKDVEPRTVVRRGSMVDVIFQSGTLTISMRAKALEDGAMGETVLIRNPDSKKNVQGEIIHENTVRVTL